MTRRDELRQKTGAAFAAVDAAAQTDAGAEAAPGELYALGGPAGDGVQWAVLRVEPGAAVVVPADDRALLGSADVAVAEAVTGCPLTLRCAFHARLELDGLADAELTGRLSPDDVAAALARLEATEAGPSAPAGEEVEASAEYRDWLGEVVEPAYAALARRAAPAKRLQFPASRPQPPARVPRPLLRAASALLLLSLGFLGGRLWLRPGTATPAADREAVVNLPIVPLSPTRTLRGGDGAPQVRLEPGVPRVALWLALREAPPSTTYRLVIAPEGGPPVWESDRLAGSEMAGATYLSVSLPARLFDTGVYHLAVFELGGVTGGAPIEEYRLEVEVVGETAR